MQHIRGINGPILGKYRVAAVSGLMTGLAANNLVFSARFAPTGNVRAAIAGLRLKSQLITPGSAAFEFTFAAYLARSFTASDSGGTAVLPSGLNNLLASIDDSSHATNFTDMRIASTGALTSGTRTVDANPILVLPAAQLSTSPPSQSYNESALEPSSDQRYVANLQGQTGGTATNAEGIIVANQAAFGTSAVVRLIVELEWYEYVTNSAETNG